MDSVHCFTALFLCLPTSAVAGVAAGSSRGSEWKVALVTAAGAACVPGMPKNARSAGIAVKNLVNAKCREAICIQNDKLHAI